MDGNINITSRVCLFVFCSVAFCSSHPYVASGGTDGTLIIWDTSNNKQRHRFVHEDAVVKLLWLPNLPIVAACTADGAVYLWDARDGKMQGLFTGHAGMIFDMAHVHIPATPGGGVGSADASPARSLIVTAGDDTLCRVYPIGGKGAPTPADTTAAPTAAAAVAEAK